jgi:multisubunit Na+/H+ antiporter MnhC subunit
MQAARISFISAGIAVLIATISAASWAQTPTVKTVEIKSSQTSYEVGQHVLLTAVAKDDRGATINE